MYVISSEFHKRTYSMKMCEVVSNMMFIRVFNTSEYTYTYLYMSK